LKAYLASPFFNKRQIEQVDSVRTQLLDLGVEVYSPKHDGILISKASGDRAMVNAYLGDIGGVRNADFVVAIMDYDDLNESDASVYGEGIAAPRERVFHGFDSGTVFEVGMARAFGIPVVFYVPAGVKMNLMLVMAGHGFTTDLKQVGQLVQDVIIDRKSFSQVKDQYVLKITQEDKGVRYD
jgi:nucleoside 2-deoxyribosyltransferase